MNQLTRRAAALGFVITLLGALFWGWGMGLSILLGVGAAWLNFHWMRGGIDRVLNAGIEQKSDLRIVVQYIARLVLILAILFAIIHFSFLSLLGGVVGLSIFVLAGMLEAVVLLYRELRRSP